MSVKSMNLNIQKKMYAYPVPGDVKALWNPSYEAQVKDPH